MKASFGASVSSLKKTSDVWFSDANYEDKSGTVNFNKSETDQITSVLSLAGRKFQTLNSSFMKNLLSKKDILLLIKTYSNVKVRAGEKITNTSKHVDDIIDYVNTKIQKDIDKVKTQASKDKKTKYKEEIVKYLLMSKTHLKNMFDMQNLLIQSKTLVIRKLEKAKGAMGTFIRTDNGFRVTAPEGFVAIDNSGKAVKLVDRLEFSRANFNAAKAWDK
jgi:hypothetical protein